MKKINQYIIEKLKVTKNTDLHICKVELDHFIPWIYDMPYYRISDLVPDDLIFPGVPFKDTMQKYFNNDPEKLYEFFRNNVDMLQEKTMYMFDVDGDGVVSFEDMKKIRDKIEEVRKK